MEEPKRRRRTKAEMAEVRPALPPFDPSLVKGRIHVTAKRVIRTGQYESFDLMLHAEFDRDPRFSVSENFQMLGSRVTEDVNALADQVQRVIGVEK